MYDVVSIFIKRYKNKIRVPRRFPFNLRSCATVHYYGNRTSRGTYIVYSFPLYNAVG